MTAAPSTIAELLEQRGDASRDGLARALGATPALTAARAALAMVPGVVAADLPWAVGEALRVACNIDWGAVLSRAWLTRQALMKYLDKEEYPPEVVCEEPLGEHEVTSEHSPRIRLLLDEVEIGTVELTVTLRLKVKGAVLRIRDGCIIGARTGECNVEGEVSWRDVTLLSESSPTLTIPGSCTFDPPLVIRDLTLPSPTP